MLSSVDPEAAAVPDGASLYWTAEDPGTIIADGAIELPRRRGVPLGVLPDAAYQAGMVCLEPGDTLVLYSDGLPDARPDLRLDPAGVAAQIAGITGVQAMLDRLVALATEADRRPDDLTLVVVRREETMAALAATPATGETLSR